MMKYLIILFAALALTGCSNQKNTKSKEVIQADGDPSYAIMRTVNNTNRSIASTVSTVPNPPVR
ncbi:hypothetical protein [Rickettsia endosymbiont of Gonocerus acuteangulatus]|uniref:hypothetical protein n=1 Tax=Rickettsia endosymbiont of Gonocerus acuteangulatus TaxID=3066266 RepID=UPI003132E8B4